MGGPGSGRKKGIKSLPKKANKTVMKKLKGLQKNRDMEINKLEKHLSEMARSEGMGTNRYKAGSDMLAKMKSVKRIK